jgi:hypothetical protein
MTSGPITFRRHERQSANKLNEALKRSIASLAGDGRFILTTRHLDQTIVRLDLNALIAALPKSTNYALFKIIAGPQDGTHYYTARKQKFTASGMADDGTTDFYLHMPNNSGALPDGATDINGEMHWAGYGWTVTEGEAKKQVWVSSEHLLTNDYVEPPA